MANNELAIPVPEPPSPELFRQYLDQATVLLKTGILPAHLKTPEQAVAVALIGRELGIPMMYAFRKVYVIQGTPCLAAELMLALAERTGHLNDCRIEHEGDICRVTIKRKGRKSPHTTEFSQADAQRLGLASKDNWTKQPKVMRQWRAISANLRVTFPDATGGLYSIEEIAPDIHVDERGEPMGEVGQRAESLMPRRKGAPAGGNGENRAGGPAAGLSGSEMRADVDTKPSVGVLAASRGEPETGRPSASDPWAELREVRGDWGDVPPAPSASVADTLRGGRTGEAAGAPPVEGARQPVGGTASTTSTAAVDMAPGPGAVTFELNGKPVVTAGITKDTLLKAYRFGTQLDDLAGKGKAKEVLGREFGVTHRTELTEPQGKAFVAELTKLLNKELDRRARQKDGR